MQYAFDFSFSVPAIGDNPGYQLTADQEFSGFQRGVMLSTGADLGVDYCSANGVERDEDLNTDEEPFDPSYCEDSSIEYFRVSSTSIGMRAYCRDELWVESIFEKISSTPAFDQGSFSMSSPELPDANTQDGVCGYILDASTTTSNVSPIPNISNLEPGIDEFWSVRLGAPYEGQRLVMNVSLMNQSQQTGTYPVNSGDLEEGVPQASVYFDSPAFDSGLATPIIRGGSVTIDSVSARQVSGSYDLLTSTGNSLTGAFDLDLD